MQTTPKARPKRSEGETLHPDCKQTKMASADELTKSIKSLVNRVKEIMEGQGSMKRIEN